MKNEAKGINRLIKAAGYSWNGLKAAYCCEEAFRQEVWLAIVLIPAGLFLGETGVEKVILCGSVILLMITELLNSAIEAVVDRLGSEWNKLSGQAKDMGSAAVLLAMVLLALSWLLVLIG